jgi:hypothetical protein
LEKQKRATGLYGIIAYESREGKVNGRYGLTGRHPSDTVKVKKKKHFTRWRLMRAEVETPIEPKDVRVPGL